MRRTLGAMLRNSGFVALIGIATLWASGCVPIPVHGPHPLSRTNVGPETIDGIAIGTTTRSELLLRLGEPDESIGADALFVYRWEETLYYLIGPNTGGRVIRQSDLEVRFDETGAVSERKVRGRILSEQDPCNYPRLADCRRVIREE